MVKFTNPPEKGTSRAISVRAPQFLQCAVHSAPRNGMAGLRWDLVWLILAFISHVKYLNLRARVLWQVL